MIVVDIRSKDGGLGAGHAQPINAQSGTQILTDCEEGNSGTEDDERENKDFGGAFVSCDLSDYENKHAVGDILQADEQSLIAIGCEIEEKLNSGNRCEPGHGRIERIPPDLNARKTELVYDQGNEKKR